MWKDEWQRQIIQEWALYKAGATKTWLLNNKKMKFLEPVQELRFYWLEASNYGFCAKAVAARGAMQLFFCKRSSEQLTPLFLSMGGLASVFLIAWGIFYAFINASNAIPGNGH